MKATEIVHRMDTAELLRRLGGVADAPTLQRLTSRGRIRSALRAGSIVRDRRNCYALPGANQALRSAVALSGHISHLSAAAYHRWELKEQPETAHVTVPRNRRVSPDRRAGVALHWLDLAPHEISFGRVTAPGRTVIDCAKTLPFDEALAVADSALRRGAVSTEQLFRLAAALSTTGRAACLRVIRAADARAANPFESVLRAIALTVPGLRVEPQVGIRLGRLVVHPDLVDVERRIVIEAESFGFHADRRTFGRDCERYTLLGVTGWLVLRFTWEQVMFKPEWVRTVLGLAVAARPRRHAALPGRARISA